MLQNLRLQKRTVPLMLLSGGVVKDLLSSVPGQLIILVLTRKNQKI